MVNAIEVKNISKSYGEVKAIENISFSIKSGEFFGLLGENGAGKSTTIECILGTKNPDKGNVSILGMNPKEKRVEIFERVGVQFQESNYQDKIKVKELCEITAALYKNSLDYNKLLEQFDLLDKSNSLVNELSGGQKQRLFIVLALVPNPDVIFFDELTTGLDTKARRDVWRRLSSLKKKKISLLLTSHFMEEVKTLCDRVMILKNGKNVFCGTVEEAMMASPYDNFEDTYLWFTNKEEKNEII